MSDNAGYSNASTSFETTEFHYEVAPEKLLGSLKRFASLLLRPLLSVELIEREINAVDSEFRDELQVDDHRLEAVLASQAPVDHVASCFSWGNKESLLQNHSYLQLRNLLVSFHEQHYKPDRMSIVVHGNAPLDELQAMLLIAFNSGLSPSPALFPCFTPLSSGCGSPFPPGCRLLEVESVRPTQRLLLHFGIASQLSLFASRPAEYWSWILGHEGRGSVLYTLRERGWATALSAGIEEVLATSFVLTMCLLILLFSRTMYRAMRCSPSTSRCPVRVCSSGGRWPLSCSPI